MNRHQEMVQHMESYAGGAFITQTDLVKFSGFSMSSVQRKMRGLPRYEGRYYCRDVVRRLMERSKS